VPENGLSHELNLIASNKTGKVLVFPDCKCFSSATTYTARHIESGYKLCPSPSYSISKHNCRSRTLAVRCIALTWDFFDIYTRRSLESSHRNLCTGYLTRSCTDWKLHGVRAVHGVTHTQKTENIKQRKSEAFTLGLIVTGKYKLLISVVCHDDKAGSRFHSTCAMKIRALLQSDKMYYTRRIVPHALKPWYLCSRASTSAWEYALSCSGRRHLKDCMFQRSEHGLHETELWTSATFKNSDRTRTVRTPANEDTIIVLVERNNEEAEATSR
jgi:hypothetical protein